MNIGFSNIYAFRPHMEHLIYLEKQVEREGHKTFFLTCDANLSACYVRELKGTSKAVECSKCILGGVRGYPVNNITSLKKVSETVIVNDEIVRKLALSSACTLNRTESEEEYNDKEIIKIIDKLSEPIRQTVNAAVKWIEDNNLEGVIVFNGRMDMTKAITYACELKGIPFLTHERTWFGNGLRINPGSDCLSIKHIDNLVKEYDRKPLTREQASYAAKLVAMRFLQQNQLEWRLYNKEPQSTRWPVNTKLKRVLVLPSSKNEFAGHPEWKSEWVSNTQALDDYMEVFNVKPEQVVIRCHPNWSENIGQVTGERSTNHYTRWAREKGVYLIEPQNKANTYDLIQESDIVILNGGSSAVEAGACGKEVVCLGPAPYQSCSFVTCFKSKSEMKVFQGHKLTEKIDVIRSTLRYVYLRAKRFPLFENEIKAVTTTDFKFIDIKSASDLVDNLKYQSINSSDINYATNLLDEDVVCRELLNSNWHGLTVDGSIEDFSSGFKLKRKGVFKLVEVFRKLIKRGDR